jgi:glycosyltransferase involved in cell wall biosynthesis
MKHDEDDSEISIVVRTRDVESQLDQLFRLLKSQTAKISQMIIVDNYSNKRKLQEMRNFLSKEKKSLLAGKVQIKLALIPNDEFTHQYSTNLGVRQADNELVCITNAHSLPISYSWLQDGVRHFQDPNVAGVSGFFYQSNERFGKNLFYLFEGPLRSIDWISTVNCIIRKSRWKEYPFDEDLPRLIPEAGRYGGEDYDWTLEMLSRGYRVVLDPKFSVIHSHSRSFLYEILRNVRNYFVYGKLRGKIKKLERPRESFTKVDYSEKKTEII